MAETENGEKTDAPATMQKGAWVVARLYVEGQDAPAHDFTETAIAAARAVITAGLAQNATPLQVALKKLEADDDPPDYDEDEDGDKQSS
jgi:hypothetical protein